MKLFHRPQFFLIASLAAAMLVTACKKKPAEDAAVVQGAASLPGAADVAAAMKKNDYDGALVALGKVKEACKTDEQNLQFSVLAGQLRQQLVEIAVTNSAAAQAANALRAMSGTLR